jgi:hypothetical protein
MTSRSKRTGASNGSDRTVTETEKGPISPMPQQATLVLARNGNTHGDVSVSSFILHVCRPLSAPSPLPFENSLMGEVRLATALFARERRNASRRLRGFSPCPARSSALVRSRRDVSTKRRRRAPVLSILRHLCARCEVVLLASQPKSRRTATRDAETAAVESRGW